MGEVQQIYCKKTHPFGEEESTLNLVSLNSKLLQIIAKEGGPNRGQFLPSILNFLRSWQKLR